MKYLNYRGGGVNLTGTAQIVKLKSDTRMDMWVDIYGIDVTFEKEFSEIVMVIANKKIVVPNTTYDECGIPDLTIRYTSQKSTKGFSQTFGYAGDGEYIGSGGIISGTIEWKAIGTSFI